MINIVFIVGSSLGFGGIETYIINQIQNLDKKLFKITLVIHGLKKGHYDNYVESLGVELHYVEDRSKNFLLNISQLNNIFKGKRYHIVHSHLEAMSSIVLFIAKMNGIKIRIAHSHNTSHLSKNLMSYLLNEISKLFLNSISTHRFACSSLAAKWLFGNRIFNKHQYFLALNTIQTKKFYFNENTRLILRDNYKVKDSFVLGHIGRFDYQKNHPFLIRLFHILNQKYPNTRLVLIGDGPEKDKILKAITTLNLKDKVIFIPPNTNVADYYSMFDLFVLPSRFEGLGIVLIESQYNNLPTLTSNFVPKEAKISDDIHFLPLKIDLWVSSIVKFIHEFDEKKRSTINPISFFPSYDINHDNFLNNFYLSEYEKTYNQ